MASKMRTWDPKRQQEVPGILLTSTWEQKAAKSLRLKVPSSSQSFPGIRLIFTGASAFYKRDIAFNRILQLAAELEERGS